MDNKTLKKAAPSKAPATKSFALSGQQQVPPGGKIPPGWRACGINPKRGEMMEKIGEAPEPALEE